MMKRMGKGFAPALLALVLVIGVLPSASAAGTLGLYSDPASGSTLYLGVNESKTFTVTPYSTSTGGYLTYSWYLDGQYVSGSSYGYGSSYTLTTYGMTQGTHTLACNAYYSDSYNQYAYGTVSWSVYVGYDAGYGANISVTTNAGVSTYYFSGTDTVEGTSVYSQLASLYGYGSYSYYIVPSYTGVASYSAASTLLTLQELAYTYLTFNTYGTWTGTYYVYPSGGTGNYLYSGTVSVSNQQYTAGTVSDITYSSVAGQAVTVSAQDFQSFWSGYTNGYGTLSSVRINSVTGGSGTLWYNGGQSAQGQTFYTNPSYYQKTLSDLVYTPTSTGRGYSTATVTISFTATGTRSGSLNTASVNGNVRINYNAQQTVTESAAVSYTCTAAGVNFKAADFLNVLLKCDYLSFGLPSFGGLYLNYGSVSQTRVTGTDRFSYLATTTVKDLGAVTYVPGGSYTGAVEIPFNGYSANGAVVKGSVRIQVKAAPTVFTDVTGEYAWAKDYVSRAAAAGIVNGVGGSYFSPGSNVTYGELLKMVLLSAGYPTQVEGSGSNWAYNYLTLAQRYKIVTGGVDLSAPVTRGAVAEIVAKTLGLTYAFSTASGVTPPTDTTSGYVYAVYNAGIMCGTMENGKNYYHSEDNITRAEISKVVCKILDYSA